MRQKTNKYNARQSHLKLNALTLALIASGAGTPSLAATVTCNTTLYYCLYNAADTVIITTSTAGDTAPLGGFGVYLNSDEETVYEANISTSGSLADAIRSNTEAVLFRANRLTINATGSSADGINLASNFNQNYDAVAIVKDYANITSSLGVGVRANNFQNANANSLILLPNGSVVNVLGTSASNNTDSVGYGVYAGNRNRDTNGLGGLDILFGGNNNTLGNAYVFVGSDAELSTTANNGHTVYANKGGLVQLGDGSRAQASGNNAFALYAATEQQGSYTDNIRPGYIYLEGGATLRASESTSGGNRNVVIQANGLGSVIASKAMAKPDVPDTFLRSDRLPTLDKSLTQATFGKFDIEGVIEAINGGEVTLNMSEQSYFKGSTNNEPSAATASSLNLSIDGSSSQWLINNDSSLSTLTLSSGATLRPYRATNELTNYVLTGNAVNNGGVWHFSDAVNAGNDGVSGDTFTLNGNYSGNAGRIILDTHLHDDTSATDLLIINGDSSGTSSVSVNNTAGNGALTAEGIKIISVAAQSDAVFELENGYKVAGAYTYRLYKNNTSGTSPNDWHLRSTLTPPAPTPTPTPVPVPVPEPKILPLTPHYHVGAPAYELYAQSLLGLNKLNTLQQRVGNRFWLNTTTEHSFTEQQGFWARIESSYWDNDPLTSTTHSDLTQRTHKMQLGLDIPAYQSTQGDLIAGLAAHYAKGDTHTHSRDYDKASISTNSYGLLGTLTWYNHNGFYIDGQAQATWYRSDLRTQTPFSPKLKDNNLGNGYALSIETGKKIPLDTPWSITPQAQLTYSAVDFKGLTDGFDSKLSNKKSDSVRGRLGITLDHESHWPDQNANTQRSHIYGIANLYYEMAGGTKVNLSGVNFVSKNDRLWGGVGIGGSYNSANDNYSIYGEALIDTSLNHPGKSYSARADIGLRIRW